VYVVFGGIILAAYDEFGGQSLLDLSPLVEADRTPLKLRPGERPADRAALPGGVGADQPAARTLARVEPPVLSLRQPVATMAPPGAASPDPGPASKADPPPGLTELPAMAPHETAPAGAGETPEPQEALGSEGSIAAAPERRRRDDRAAKPLRSRLGGLPDQAPQAEPAAASPPAPALKPLEAVPIVVAEATLPAVPGSEPARSRLGDDPPLPSLKPIVMPSERRPGSAVERDTRRAAATRPTLPDAFRAFWTNLKILLASGTAPQVIPAGGNNGDGRGGRGGGRGDVANASGGSGTTGSGSRGSSGSSSSNGSANAGSAGGAGGSTSSGGSSGSEGGASSSTSGGDGGNASAGNGGGRGGGRGGRDGDRGGGRGGRGGGDDRGGDDDDDDDD
jgi:hypothetical protein